MLEVLKEIVVYLESSGIMNLLITLISSFLCLLIVCLKTRTASIQKKAGVTLSSDYKDYIILIDSLNVRVALDKVKIKKRDFLTKEEANKYKEV